MKIFLLLICLCCLTACDSSQPPKEGKVSVEESTQTTKVFNENRILEAVKNFPSKGKDNKIYPLSIQLERFKEDVSAGLKKEAEKETDYQSQRLWMAFYESYRQMTYEWHAYELHSGLWEVLLIMHQPSPAGDDVKSERTFLVDTKSKIIKGNSQSCQFLDENLTGVFNPNDKDKSERCRFEMTNL